MTNNEALEKQRTEKIELSSHEIAEYQEQLHDEHNEREKSSEQLAEKQEQNAENARHEIEKITAEHEPKKHETAVEQHGERKIDSKAARKKAYNSIMSQARAEMSAPERAFSKFIHTTAIEKLSDLTGNTVARPAAILAGAVSAFLLTLVIYLIAKKSGYPLTGSETIAAFIIGWAVGNIFDFAKSLLRGGR